MKRNGLATQFVFSPRLPGRTPKALLGLCLCSLLLLGLGGQAGAQNEIVTVPVILVDYYAWPYTEIFKDRADVFGWSTAGVDALGWGILTVSPDYTGLFLVNTAGVAKTVYPLVALLSSSDHPTRDRAWIALGTHTATLLTLQLMGQPAIGIQAMGPRRDTPGITLACRF